MATWKKVIVSGSDAILNQVTASGGFSGDGSGLTGILADSVGNSLTDGNGIVDFTFNGSAGATVAVQVSGSTLEVGTNGVRVANSGITATQIATSVAGAGLSGGGGTALAVNVDDTSIEIDTDTLRVKALGVTDAMLAGSITNAKLVNDSVTIGSTSVALGATTASLAGLTTVSSTSFSGSFSGSFQGDGSGLTGIATDLAIAGETGTGTVSLENQTLTVTGGEGINTVASGQTITISGEDASSSNKGIASFSDDNFTVTAGDVVLANDVDIVQDLTVGRNLTVIGTASFQSTENLDVADRWIRMASGSNAAGDGGIAIVQSGSLNAEAFGWDSAVARWGVTGSFDASQGAIVPDAFMASVVEGGESDPTAVVAKYVKKGNIFVAANGDIFIYS